MAAGIHAPWTEEQIVKIKTWQAGTFHEMTCPDHSDVPLKVLRTRLFCPAKDCEYEQHWVPEVVVR